MLALGSYPEGAHKTFYMDRFWRIKYPFTILLLIGLAVLIDFLTSTILGLEFFPRDYVELIAYLMRLFSIAFAFFSLRTVYYRAMNVINSLIDMSSGERRNLASLEATFLNKPSHHIIAGICFNFIYLIILFIYVFPILRWSPYHLFSNSLWVGVLGIGFYVCIFSIKFVNRFMSMIKKWRAVDLYHEWEGLASSAGYSRMLSCY